VTCEWETEQQELYKQISNEYRAVVERNGLPALDEAEGILKWSVVAARERAKLLRREIDAGEDPLVDREDSRAAPRVADLIERYIGEHVLSLAPRNAADQVSMLRKLVEPDWRNRLVAEITPADVERLLNRVAEGRAQPAKEQAKSRGSRTLRQARPTPIRANRRGEMLRKMFTLAVAWKMRTENPATGFRLRIETERFLSLEEIGRLADALGAAEDQRAASIVRLCMLTGARLGEVRQARFEQINLKLLAWTKPATTTKQRRVHRLPISPDAAALIRQRPTAVPGGCPWLFPGEVEGASRFRRSGASGAASRRAPSCRTFASMTFATPSPRCWSRVAPCSR
jgi:integrase